MYIYLQWLYHIFSSEAVLPEKSTPVGHLTYPILPSTSKVEHVGQKLERMDTKLDHGLTLFNPTEMSKVLYSESYDDYMHKSNPVQPTCHCWTPEQSIYVGCVGGQLLMLESDSGLTKVIANPQLTVCSCSVFAILRLGFYYTTGISLVYMSVNKN